jgi:hypothetical protein
MAVSALLLTLAAAVVHAAWNLLLADAPDTHTASAVAITVGVVVFAPVAAVGWCRRASVRGRLQRPRVAVPAAANAV